MSTWELRAMRDDDRNYVLSSWLRSYAEVSRRHRQRDAGGTVTDPGGEFRFMDRDTFFGVYEPVVERLLARSQVVIATQPDLDETDTVLGWMAIEADALHYVLVKPRWRKLGIAKWLIGQVGDVDAVYTHAPPPVVGGRLIPRRWRYDGARRFEREREAA